MVAATPGSIQKPFLFVVTGILVLVTTGTLCLVAAQFGIGAFAAVCGVDQLENRIHLNQEKLTRISYRGPDFLGTQKSNLQIYRELLARRPTWPPYWTGLIQAKLNLWQWDQEMQQAIITAAQLGPWFPATQRMIVRAGFEGWPFLEKRTQQALDDTLQRALSLQPENIIRLALDRGFVDRIMPIISSDPNLQLAHEKTLRQWEKDESSGLSDAVPENQRDPSKY